MDEPPPLVVPAVHRTETVREDKAIDGALIAVSPAASASWRVQVTNNTDATMSVVLDESTFTSANGESGGRLINSQTRRIDIAREQPPVPIAPGATWSEFVLVEKLAFFEDYEAEIANKAKQLNEGQFSSDDRRRLGGMLLDGLTKNRANAAKLIVGGKIYITVDGANGKQTWSGVVEEGE